MKPADFELAAVNNSMRMTAAPATLGIKKQPKRLTSIKGDSFTGLTAYAEAPGAS